MILQPVPPADTPPVPQVAAAKFVCVMLWGGPGLDPADSDITKRKQSGPLFAAFLLAATPPKLHSAQQGLLPGIFRWWEGGKNHLLCRLLTSWQPPPQASFGDRHTSTSKVLHRLLARHLLLASANRASGLLRRACTSCTSPKLTENGSANHRHLLFRPCGLYTLGYACGWSTDCPSTSIPQKGHIFQPPSTPSALQLRAILGTRGLRGCLTF